MALPVLQQKEHNVGVLDDCIDDFVSYQHYRGIDNKERLSHSSADGSVSVVDNVRMRVERSEP